MEKLSFENAYFIKLGESGKWEKSSIDSGKVRIGWGEQSKEDINAGEWKKIGLKIREEQKNKSVATREINDLMTFCKSTSNDIWITFYHSKLWWCRLAEKNIHKDKLSKYRNSLDGWHDRSRNGTLLIMNSISGNITKTRGYRGTLCKFKEEATEELARLLNDEYSKLHKDILSTRSILMEQVSKVITSLNAKDFEVLVDIMFRQSGWRRVSMLGKAMRDCDMELQDPINGDRYLVQVKTSAGLNDLKEYKTCFDEPDFRRMFFVVSRPEGNLSDHEPDEDSNIRLLLPQKIAEMVVDLGLTKWVMDKIK